MTRSNRSPAWAVLFMLRDSTREKPVTLAEIRDMTDMSARSIKAAVEALRLKGKPIGSSRGKHPGYYVVRTAEDAEAAAGPLVRQALAMLRTAKAMLPAARYRELLGQARLDGTGEISGT